MPTVIDHRQPKQSRSAVPLLLIGGLTIAIAVLASVYAPKIMRTYKNDASEVMPLEGKVGIEETSDFDDDQHSQTPTKPLSDVEAPKIRAAVDDSQVVRRELSTNGERLFENPLLSVNGKVSCHTCHPANKGYSMARPPSLNDEIERKAPSLFNLANSKSFFWDGRASSLEDQIRGPLTNRDEMGEQTVAEAARRVGMSEEDLVRELATYVRSLSRKNERLDTFLAGRDAKLSQSEIRGFNLFRGAARCYKCHPVGTFTDDKFHNTGVGFADGYFADGGRYFVTNRDSDKGAFKTPGLYGVGMADGFMHDGSLRTLAQVVEFYDRGGIKNRHLDREMQPLGLTRDEKIDLVTFLKGL